MRTVLLFSFLVSWIFSEDKHVQPDRSVDGDILSIDSVITYSTFNSIGLEFWISGDLNQNSVNSRFSYHERSESTDTTFYPLMRSFYQCPWPNGCYVDSLVNKWAGSLMYLEAGRVYTIDVAIEDPDGGGIDTTLIVRTRDYPSRTDIGTGRVGYRNFQSPGCYDLEGDTLTHINLYSDSVYIDNFYISNFDSAVYPREAIRHVGFQNLNNITLKNGVIDGEYERGIEIVGSNWFIDSVYVSNGDCAEFKCLADHLGIVAGVNPSRNIMPNGTVISNVKIDSVGDGIKFGYGGVLISGYNIDIFNCEINDVADDAIELDQLQSNVRVWNNRIKNPDKNGISFQPQVSGPWYIMNNTIEGYQYSSALKLAAVDGGYLVDNKFYQNGVEDDDFSDVAVIRNAHFLSRFYMVDNRFEYKGQNRGKKLNSYILYSNGKNNSPKMINHHSGNIYVKPENPNVLENNWQGPLPE